MSPFPTKLLVTLCVQKPPTKLPHFPRREKISPTEGCVLIFALRQWILRHIFSNMMLKWSFLHSSKVPFAVAGLS